MGTQNGMEYIASLVVGNAIAIHSEVFFQTCCSLLPTSNVLANVLLVVMVMVMVMWVF